MKILIDVDGVLAKTSEKVLALYNKEYAKAVSVEDLIFWEYEKCPNLDAKAGEMFFRKDFFKDIEVTDGAQEMVRSLLSMGHDLIIATAVFRNGYEDRHEWLSKWFPEIPESNYIFGARKDLLAGDVLLDDKVSNLIGGSTSIPVLLDQPWNQTRSYPEAKSIARVKSLSDFISFIESMTKVRGNLDIFKAERIA